MRLSLFAAIDRWLAPAPPAGRADWIGEHVYAHRGLHGPGVPENSPSAFAAALDRGLGIECDIQLSADSEAMVFHDWELDRLTARSGAVRGTTAADLAATGLSGSEDCIPTLKAFLAQVAGKVPLLIEVKSRKNLPIDKVCAAVDRALAGYSGLHAVMSFDPRVSHWFAANASATVRGLVVTEENGKGLAGRVRRYAALLHARPDFLAYDIRDLPSRFPASQRARGLPVATWTVRSAEQRTIAARHADAPIAEGPGLEAAA